MRARNTFFDRVYAIVRQVPRGKVVSYGQVAAWLGSPSMARAVGYALHALRFDKMHDVPWQRVINSAGRISFRSDDVRGIVQRHLLESEGVQFDAHGVVDFRVFGWMPATGYQTKALGPRDSDQRGNHKRRIGHNRTR